MRTKEIIGESDIVGFSKERRAKNVLVYFKIVNLIQDFGHTEFNFHRRKPEIGEMIDHRMVLFGATVDVGSTYEETVLRSVYATSYQRIKPYSPKTEKLMTPGQGIRFNLSLNDQTYFFDVHPYSITYMTNDEHTGFEEQLVSDTQLSNLDKTADELRRAFQRGKDRNKPLLVRLLKR